MISCCEIKNRLYGTQLREGKADGDGRVELCVTETYAKENGLWLPINEMFALGTPGPCGNENDTYVSYEIIYRVLPPMQQMIHMKIA